MKRLPALAFAALAAATVFAFFLTQHLKTELPVLWGRPLPAAFNPVNGRLCPGSSVNYRRTQLSVTVPRGGTIGVFVINQSGQVVATVSSGRNVGRGQTTVFSWNGRESGGRIAPDGTYFFRITLVQQQRTVNLLRTPITVMTRPPHPTITDVALSGASGGGGGATTSTTATTASGSPAGDSQQGGRRALGGPVILTPPGHGVTIHFPLHDYRRVWIDVYRTDVSGKPTLINHYAANAAVGHAHWNGNTAAGTPAPAGTYLIGLTAQDQACNQANYPVVLPPAPGTTLHTGVTVRYLAATAPLGPIAAGARATIAVQSPTGRYGWKLQAAGERRVLRHGHGAAGESTLGVRLPRKLAGLYTLTLRAGTHATSVPLVVAAAHTQAARARVLVVLPMLTWQGENPVDDSGDGLPSTLAAGDPVLLDQPLADGLPRGYHADVALLNFLRQHRLHYQLTTDVALARGEGPSLTGRWGVVLAGDETWLPHALVQELQGFVKGGGRVLSIGTDALRGSTTISGPESAPRAAAAVRMSPDLFGAKHGPRRPTDGELVTELTDQLGIFASVPALPGYRFYAPVDPPAGASASLAGVAAGAPAVAAFGRGRGYVVEISVGGFAQSLAGNADAQELLARVWQLLSR